MNQTDPNKSWSELFRSNLDWLLVASLAALSPMLFAEAQWLWSRPHFQFFPLVVVLCFFLVWQRTGPDACSSVARVRVGAVGGGIGLVLAGLAAWIFSPWLAHLALLLLVTAWGLVRLGQTPWHQVLALSSLLWVTLPLPMELDGKLIRRLQIFSTSSAAPLMDLASIPHLATGNVLEVKSGRLFVDEACSGVDSLYALIAVAVVLAVVQRTGFLIGLLTLFCAPVWAWFGNTIRLFAIAFLLEHYGMDFSHGWKHTLLGMFVFAFSFLCMFATQHALVMLIKPFPIKTITSGGFHSLFNWIVCWPGRDPTTRKKIQVESNPSLPSHLPRPFLQGNLRIVVVALALVAIAGKSLHGFIVGPSKVEMAAGIKIPKEDVAINFQADAVPEDLGGMKLAHFEVIHRPMSKLFYGEHSAIWHFLDGERKVQLSLDFPFPGFHALEVCYVGSGREMVEPRTSIDRKEYAAQIGSPIDTIEEIRLHDQAYGDSYLIYAEFDANGNDVWRLGNRVTGSLPARIAHSLKLQAVTFQTQLYISGSGNLTDEERERYQEILLDVSHMLLPKIKAVSNR
ncbi:MAG: exosortase U [Pirellulaceae bacterium]